MGIPVRKRGGKGRGKHFALRNWLNIVFLVGAVAGLLLYYLHSNTVGTVVILAAMVFKMAESIIRMTDK